MINQIIIINPFIYDKPNNNSSMCPGAMDMFAGVATVPGVEGGTEEVMFTEATGAKLLRVPP